MIPFKKNPTKKIIQLLPIITIVSLIIIFFYKFFFLGLHPIPSDIITGVYYPWLDYKWENLVGVAVKNPLMSDIPSLIYPWRILAIEQMKNWQLPIINPYSYAGYPLLGNWQAAPFTLPNIFFLIFPDHIAWSLGIILQPLLASLFMYQWLKSKKINTLPSLTGAILYSYSGFHLTWMYYNTHKWVTMWLPLTLYSIDKIHNGLNKQKPKKNKYYSFLINKWTLLLTLSLTFSILAGYPILLIYQGIIIFTYLMSKIFSLRHNKILFISALSLCLIIGLGLSAPQWLPAYQNEKTSIHQYDNSTLNSANQGKLPQQNFITYLAPDFFGNPATGNYWGIGYYDNWGLHMSITGITLALLGLLSFTRIRIYLLIFLIGVALSTDNLLSHVIYKHFPLLRNSIPSRAIYLQNTAIAILAVYGMQNMNLSYKKTKTKFLYLIPVIIITICLIIIWIINLNYPELIPNLKENLSIAKRNLILPTLLIGSIIVIWLSNWKLKFSRKFIPIIVFSLIILELFRYGWKYLPFTPKQYLYPPTEITNWLISQKNTQPEPFRIEFGEVIPQNMWIPYRLESPGGYDALAPYRYSQFLEAIQSHKLSRNISRFPLIENFTNPLFQLTNTKYLLAVKYDEHWRRSKQGIKLKDIYNQNFLKPVYNYDTVTILENEKFINRAYFVNKAQTTKNDQQLINILTDPSTDLTSTVFLENTNNQNNPKLIEQPSKLKYQINWLSRSDEPPKIQIESNSSGYLVILNNYIPGWTAYINNQPTKIYRANFTFMAIPINQGNHLVELKYQPKSFKYGIYILISTISLIMVILIYKNKSNK